MSKFQKPGNITPTECVFPECGEHLSEKFELPLCDRHIVKVYRAVVSYQDIMATEGNTTGEGSATG